MKVFDGDIIEQRNDSLEFVKKHIQMEAEIKGTERLEKWEYPIEAIREAITNAICHRDYKIASNVQIRIFDDRLEVWGCGPLPDPLTVEDLKKEHRSILRNPLIAKCFFLIKFIEKWGTGTNRIIEKCLEHGLQESLAPFQILVEQSSLSLPEPLFEETSGSLVVTFRKYEISDDIMKKLSDREKKIIEHIKKEGKISRSECVELLDVSSATAYRDLKSLEEQGIVKRKGKSRNIIYELK